MTQAYKEVQIGKGAIYRVDAPFDEALEVLGKNLISTWRLANARMQTDKANSLNTYGSYNGEGFVYAAKSEPLIVRASPLLDSKLARKAIEANRQGRYFTTEDRKLYDEQRAIAEKNKDKEPFKRQAIILPSRGNFEISSELNAETFEFLFGKDGKKYLSFVGRNNLTVYLVDPSTVDSQNGTLLTQSWLHRVVLGSVVSGDNRYLGYYYRVRGVCAPLGALTSEASSAQKISRDKVKVPYTSRQLDKMAEVLDGVRQGNLPASRLEKVAQFIQNLRKE